MRPSGAVREPSRESGAVLTAQASQSQARDSFLLFFQVINQGNGYDDDDVDDDDDDDEDDDDDDDDDMTMMLIMMIMIMTVLTSKVMVYELYTIQDDNLAKKQYPCTPLVHNRKI